MPFESNLNSSISLLLNDNKPKLKYKGQFTSDRADKFLRKFGVYDFEPKKTTFYSEGTIDIDNQKIKFLKILKNNIRLNNDRIKVLEESFNENVLDDGLIGLFDLFNFKKFFKEIY